MRQCAKAVVNVDPNETLYFHWFNDWIEAAGLIRPANIPCPDQSVNRSGLGGRSWYVLIPDPVGKSSPICKGIVGFSASHIPDPIGAYSFVVEHDPLLHNYHHCEVRVFKNGDRTQVPDKEYKKHYRTELAKHARILLLPEISTNA